MRKPPIFWQPLTGNKAQDYLHRARMFKDAATQLPDYSNAQQNWPKYALLTHAIELSLKAFADHSVATGKPRPAKQPKQHDLTGWYKLALHYGLPDEPSVAENMALLNFEWANFACPGGGYVLMARVKAAARGVAH
jgi:hypothetical protein